MVLSEYANFFLTAATAGGALIGLLFVAVSLAPERTVLSSAPVVARIVAASTFTALTNAFFISLAALLPHTNIGWFALVMSLIGMSNSLSQWRTLLIPRPAWQNVLRRTWLIALSVCIYIMELVCSLQLLFSPENSSPLFYLALSVLLMNAIALIRAWELLGVQRTGLFAWLNPLYDINKGEQEEKNPPSDDRKKETR